MTNEEKNSWLAANEKDGLMRVSQRLERLRGSSNGSERDKFDQAWLRNKELESEKQNRKILYYKAIAAIFAVVGVLISILDHIKF